MVLAHRVVMRRELFRAVVIAAGLFIVGGLFGLGARTWGLDEQRAQLHRCILTSQQSHPSDDARTKLAHLDVEVPECMAGAGYEKALNNDNCSLAVWQGDVYCYLPKSLVGKLMYRIATISSGNTSDQDEKSPFK